MAARVNTRFVMVLASVLVLLALGVASAWYFVLRKDPTENIARGDAFMAQQQYEEAQEQYGRAYHKRNSDVSIISKLITATELTPVKDSRAAQEAVGRMRMLLDRLTTIDTRNPEYFERMMGFYLRIGRDLNDVGAFNFIVERADGFLNAEPNSPIALKYRGIAQVNRIRVLDVPTEKRDEAREDLLAALAQYPDDRDVLYHLAMWNLNEAQLLDRAGLNVARSRQLKAQVRELAQRLMENHENDLTRKMDRIRLLMELGDQQLLAAELALAETSFKNNPASPEVTLDLADALLRTDRQPVDRGPNLPPITAGLQRAMAILEAAAKVHTQDIRILSALAQAYQQKLDFETALKTYDQLLTVSVYGTPMQALTFFQIQVRSKLQRAEVLLMQAERMREPAERDKVYAKVQSAIDEVTPVLGADTAFINMLAGKLAMAQGKWAQATTYIDRASAQFKDQNLEVLALSARVRQMSGETGAAASRYRAILERHPNILPVRLELAQLLIQLRQFDEAQAQLATVLAATPNDARALQLQGALLMQAGDTEKALATLAKVDTNQNPEAALVLAQAQLQAGKLKEARQIIQPRFERDPKDARLLQLMLRTADNPEQAKAIIAQAKAGGANPDLLDVLEKSLDQQANIADVVEGMIDRGSDPYQQAMQRFSLFRQTGRAEDARKELAKAAQLKPDEPVVIENQFAVAIDSRDWEAAKRLADRAGTMNLDLAEGNFYLGQLALAQGSFDRATAAFRKGLGLRPVYSDGWRMLGDAQRMAGEIAESDSAYRTALDQLPTNVAALRGIAGTYDLQKDHVRALDALRRAIDLSPNDRALLNTYMAYEEMHGDPGRALQMRQRLAQANPNDAGNLRATAILMARTRQFDSARNIMEGLFKTEGKTTMNLAAMVTVLSIAEQRDQARQLLLDHLREKGDKATADDWVLLAKFNMANNNEDEALYAFRKAIAVEDPKTRAASRELADLMFDRGLFSDALAYYQQLHENDKSDLRVAHRYTEALLRAGNTELAETVLAEIKKQQVNESVATKAISWVLEGMVARARNQDDRAVRALQEAITLQPTRALFHYQLAEHLSNRTDRDKLTIDAINKALELDRNLTPARMLLARILVRQRDIPEAIRELVALLKIDTQSIPARRMLAELYDQSDMFDALRTHLDESVKMFPRDTSWLRLQARLAQRERNSTLARDKLIEAVRLSPSPDNLAELAMQYLRMNQPEQAVTLLENNAAVRDAQPGLSAIAGRALWALNRQAEAKPMFERALRSAQSFGQVMFVNDQLANAMTFAGAVTFLEPFTLGASNTLWSELAVLTNLVADGRFKDALERAKKSELLIKPNTPERLAADRLIALAHHRTGEYQRARQMYERVLQADPDSVASLNNLAYLLTEHLGQAGEGLKHAQEAATLAPNDAQVLDTLGWAQFKVGQSNEALRTLRRSVDMNELAANHFHLAEVLIATGNRSDGVRFLERAIKLAEEQKESEYGEAARKRLTELRG